jgi:hypothetical protein
MGGIRLVNQNEVWLPPQDESVYPFTIIADVAEHYQKMAPVDGEVEALVLVMVNAPTQSVGHIQEVIVWDGGADGTGTDPATGSAFCKNGGTVPAAGDVLIAEGNGRKIHKGDILRVHIEESGTPGGTDAIINILGIKYRAHDHVDPQFSRDGS